MANAGQRAYENPTRRSIAQRTRQAAVATQRAQPRNASKPSKPSYPGSLLNTRRALSGRGNQPVQTALMRDMQQTYGNRATQRFLQRSTGISADNKSEGAATPEEDQDSQFPVQTAPASTGFPTLQRLTDEEKAKNLSSPKFAGNARLEQAFDNSPVMKLGEKSGDPIKLVQEGLVADGFAMPISTKSSGEMDGVFGDETFKTIVKFQTKHGLGPDGRVGRETMGKLDELAKGSGPGPKPIPPKPVPPKPVPPKPKPATAPTVTFSKVRSPSTPAAMTADRIPPRVDIPVKVTVSGLDPASPPVTVSLTGGSAANGTATVNGGASATLTGDGAVVLQGGTQTSAPASAGNLHLVAKQGAATLATSNGFSVSSIPTNYSDTFVSLVTGARRGIVVQDGWESDSGTFADLDKTEISERVEHKVKEGCFASTTSINSGYLPGNNLTQDTHSSGASIMTSFGFMFTDQTCMFKDNRTGAVDIPMTNSGFNLTRIVDALFIPITGKMRFTISKNGAPATAKGITSAAGTCAVTKTQDV